MDKPIDLAAIRARRERVTQDTPWSLRKNPDGTCTVLDDNGAWVAEVGEAPLDAEFIAHAPTDVDALLARVEELEKELAGIREVSDPDGELVPESTTRDRMMHWCEAAGCLKLANRTVSRRTAERDRLRALLEKCERKLGYLLRDYPDDKETRGILDEIRKESAP